MRNKFLFAVFGVLMWALVYGIFFDSEPPERQPAAIAKKYEPQFTAQIVSKQEIPALPVHNSNEARAEARFPKHSAEEQWRVLAETHAHKAAQEPGPDGENWNELSDVKAVAKRVYNPEMGSEVARQAGYVLFNGAETQSRIGSFDGTHLPVVQRPGSATLGIITGEVEVTFKVYPEDIRDFARKNGLTVVSEATAIKTAFLTPKSLPADLYAVTENLARHQQVERAVISILFGAKRGL